MPMQSTLWLGMTVSFGMPGPRWLLFSLVRFHLGQRRLWIYDTGFALCFLHRLLFLSFLVLSRCAIRLHWVLPWAYYLLLLGFFLSPRGDPHNLPIPSNSLIRMLLWQSRLFANFVTHAPTSLGSFGRSAGKSLFLIVRIHTRAMEVC